MTTNLCCILNKPFIKCLACNNQCCRPCWFGSRYGEDSTSHPRTFANIGRKAYQRICGPSGQTVEYNCKTEDETIIFHPIK